MILLAISGGPDSMFLLNEYKKSKVVIAHINYNVRLDSHVDEQIVKDFCNKHNMPFEILSIQTKLKGNFQNEARKIRYEFFQKIYKKYNCSKLMMAHHKDDFLETALMQQKSGRFPRYFGMKKKNILYDMNIVRPFLHMYWKREILRYLHKKEIKFAIDSSNAKPIYERNKIRLELSQLHFSEKRDQYQWFKISNKILNKKFKKVDFWFKKWAKTQFSIVFFSNILKYKEELVYEYIHQTFERVNLSKDKIKSIIMFIEGKEGNKKFLVSNKYQILKKDGILTRINL